MTPLVILKQQVVGSIPTALTKSSIHAGSPHCTVSPCRFQTRSFNCSRARYTRLCTSWRRTSCWLPSGSRPIPVAKRSSMRWPLKGGSGWKMKFRIGNDCPARCPWS